MGSVTATVSASSANVSLTALGGADFAIYNGDTSLATFHRKNGGGAVISVAEYDPNGSYSVDSESKSRTFSATDATPTASVSSGNCARAVSFGSVNPVGFTITLPAGTGQRTAKLYVMAYNNNSSGLDAEVVCTLADGSGNVTTNYTINAGADNFLVIDLTYTANSTTTLSARFNLKTASSSAIRAVHFGAAWVSSPPATNNYTLDTTTGSFTVTGVSSTTLKSSLLSVTPGAYALNAVNAELRATRFLSVTNTNFTLTGFDSTAFVSQVLDTTPGAYAVTGAQGDLSVSLALLTSPGSLSLTGSDATLTYERVNQGIETLPGAYELGATYAELIYTPLTPDTAYGSYASSRRRRR